MRPLPFDLTSGPKEGPLPGPFYALCDFGGTLSDQSTYTLGIRLASTQRSS